MNKHVIKLSKFVHIISLNTICLNYIWIFFTAASELTDAKEKLAKVDSSSSESEDETTPKRKKPINHIDKPTEEVR